LLHLFACWYIKCMEKVPFHKSGHNWQYVIFLCFCLYCYAYWKSFSSCKVGWACRDFTRFDGYPTQMIQQACSLYNVVLFSFISSPLMLSATLHHHLDSHQWAFAKNNFYVICQLKDEILSYTRAIISNSHFNLFFSASNSSMPQ